MSTAGPWRSSREAELQPSVFYQWLRQALGNLGAALGPPVSDAVSKQEKELVAETEELETKLAL